MAKKKLSLEQAYDAWNKWLDKCPVPWTSGRHPTSGLETINFDFIDFESEEE